MQNQPLNVHELWGAVELLTDDEWLDLLLRTSRGPRMSSVDPPGVPPDDFQRRYNGQAGEANISSAFDFYQVVKESLGRHGTGLGRDSRVLDFGCGWGRITRMFLKDVLADNLYGIDIDQSAITMANETFGCGTFSVNSSLPPTGF